MSAKQRDELIDRANKMSDALKIETHRGSACVGDAMLDELYVRKDNCWGITEDA